MSFRRLLWIAPFLTIVAESCDVSLNTDRTYVALGSRVSVTCHVCPDDQEVLLTLNGEQIVQYWEFSGPRVVDESLFAIKERNASDDSTELTLTILNFTTSMIGTYECFIFNTTDRASVALDGGLLYERIAQFGEQNLQLDYNFSWNSVEQKLVKCYKDNDFIGQCSGRYIVSCSLESTSVGKYKMSTTAELTRVHVFIAILNELTSGTYICYKENSIHKMAYLLFKTVPLVSVTMHPGSAITYPVYNETSTFTCMTSPSKPLARIQWFVDDRNITDMASKTDNSDVTTSVLRYTPSNYDSHNLTCIASYSYTATTVSKQESTELQIQYPVSKPTITRNATIVSETLILHEDIPLEVQCYASGYPPPYYRWLYPGGQKNGSTVVLKFNRTFRDERITCGATNTYYSLNGSYTAFSTTAFSGLKLYIISRPDVPKSFCIRSVTDTTIKLRWEPGFNGGDEQCFVLRFKKTPATNWTDAHVDIGNEYTLVGLETGTGYELKIFGENVVGKSEEMDPIISGTLLSNSTYFTNNTVVQECIALADHDYTCISTTLLIGTGLGCIIAGGILALVGDRLVKKLQQKLIQKRNRSSGRYDNLQPPNQSSTSSAPSDQRYERLDFREKDSKIFNQYETLSETSVHEYSGITKTTTTATTRQNSSDGRNKWSENTSTTSFSDVQTYGNLALEKK